MVSGFVFLGVLWILLTRYLGARYIVVQYPKISAIIDFVLIPYSIILIGSLVRVFVRESELPDLDGKIRVFVVFLFYLVIAWCVARLIEVFAFSKSSAVDATRLPALLRGLFYGVCLLIGFLSFLIVYDYSVTGVYISTGAIAAILAFAMQRTLGDLFSGIAMSVERPFKIGDWIVLNDGTEGKIIDINWRTTRLRGWDNAIHVVPNGDLAQQRFKNLQGPNDQYAPWYEVKISSEIEPRIVKAVLLEAVLRCDKVLKTPLPVIRLKSAATIPYTYMIWVHFPNYPSMFAGREEIFREIHYALGRAGANVAPVIQEIHTRRSERTSFEPQTPLLALKALDLAKELTEEEINKISAMSKVIYNDVGTVLLDDGSVATFFDIIINGVVESSALDSQNTYRAVERLSPGQYFGITSMITESPSLLKFTALSDVTLLRVEVSCIQEILSERPSLSASFAEIVKRRLDKIAEIQTSPSDNKNQKKLHNVLLRIERLLD